MQVRSLSPFLKVFLFQGFREGSGMGSVWKRLNRINKRAAKFHFTASYSELWLEVTPPSMSLFISFIGVVIISFIP